jgi:hypothetical protein
VSGHQPASSSPGCSGVAGRRPFLFYQFVRLPQDVVPQLPDAASKRLDVLFQFRTLMVWCWLLLAIRGCCDFTTE